MDQYELEALYEALDQTRVNRADETRFWTVVQRVTNGTNFHLDNPTNRGPETLLLETHHWPHSVAGAHTESLKELEDDSLPPDWEDKVVYVERVNHERVKLVPDSDWPDDDEVELFPDHSLEDRDISDSETKGSPQNVQTDTLSNRRDVFKADDPRGSKNDLLK